MRSMSSMTRSLSARTSLELLAPIHEMASLRSASRTIGFSKTAVADSTAKREKRTFATSSSCQEKEMDTCAHSHAPAAPHLLGQLDSFARPILRRTRHQTKQKRLPQLRSPLKALPKNTLVRQSRMHVPANDIFAKCPPRGFSGHIQKRTQRQKKAALARISTLAHPGEGAGRGREGTPADIGPRFAHFVSLYRCHWVPQVGPRLQRHTTFRNAPTTPRGLPLKHRGVHYCASKPSSRLC